jgi:hypothetical protein
MISHFGNWSSIGVPNLLDKIIDSKQCSNWAFNIPLEISLNLNIKIGLTFSTWSCELGITAKKVVKSQIGN